MPGREAFSCVSNARGVPMGFAQPVPSGRIGRGPNATVPRLFGPWDQKGVAMAVVTECPERGKLVEKGPVGTNDSVSNDDYRFLAVGLPAEVERLKQAGRLREAIEACDRLLAAEPTPELAACLRVERHRMERLAQQFCVTREAALEAIRAEWPKFSERRLDDLIARGRIDWRYIEGEQRFLDNFLDSLRVYPKEVPGLKPDDSRDMAKRDAMLARMHEQGGLTCDISIKASIAVPGAGEGEMLRAWLPVAAACPQQSQIEVYDWTPGVLVAGETAAARTAFWGSTQTREFEVSYRYRISAPYVDTLAEAPAAHVVSDDTVTDDDLSELAPHIVFTPYLRTLTERTVAGIERPIDQVRAIYDYITKHVDYRYQPSYAQLDCIPDGCAKSLRGDCGVMALTFITMCRIAGIPARWQSGLYVSPDYIGPHDWAMFYTEEFGWLWADCSFGSSARREGDEARRLHYFGNLDPWRMVANSRFQADLAPACDGVRWDPFDNQMGEASVAGRGCDHDEMLRSVELLEMKEV